MAEQQKEDSQKTVVSFIVGLLVGGLLVWAFSGPSAPAPKVNDTKITDSTTTATDTTKTTEVKTDSKPVTTNTTKVTPVVASLPTGEGAVKLEAVPAGMTVSIKDTIFPSKEGWIGVRDYTDGKLGGILGVARFSAEQGLVPTEISLLRATVAGKQYAIVFYSENGDRKFNLANDVQIPKEFATFTAK